MGENTKIEWAHHTFNGWWGCVRVSPACEHCYAETFAKRVGQKVWGVDAPRRFFGDKHWNEPLKWNRSAEAQGERKRVFAYSMADICEDRDELRPWRERQWELIDRTPWLDWLLLTKRIALMGQMVPSSWMREGGWPVNVWPGTTVEDRRRAEERLPDLCALPSLQKIVSVEPHLGDLGDISPWLYSGFTEPPQTDVVTWVIDGGESGHGARPTHPDWRRLLMKQCRAAGVAYFFKQHGEWIPVVPVYADAAHPDPDGENTGDDSRQITLQNDGAIPVDEERVHYQPDPATYPWVMERVGKKAAGRLLLGREWNAVPAHREWPPVGAWQPEASA